MKCCSGIVICGFSNSYRYSRKCIEGEYSLAVHGDVMGRVV